MELPPSILMWFLPLAIITSGFIVGKFFEKTILARLGALTEKTHWEGDDILIRSLKGIAVVWFTVGGIYLAMDRMPLSPSFSNLTHKVLLGVLIFSATVAAGRAAGGLVGLYSNRIQEALPQTSILTNLVRATIYATGLLVLLQTLGVSIAPILTALGVGGLAVALALQDTLSNLFAGFHIIISRQIRPGDYVRLDSGEEGYVADINWRNTSIRTLPNNMVIVPNSKMAGAILTNYYQPDKELAVPIEVGVSYSSDLAKVEQVTLEVAGEVLKEVAGGVPSFEPAIRYHAFGDFSIRFTAVLRCREFRDQYLLKHEFIRRLNERYQKEGIEIPFPIRTVHLNPLTLPSPPKGRGNQVGGERADV